MNVLFVCNQGLNRSRTAAELFASRFTTNAAGLYNDAPVTEQEINRADLVVVMEDIQRTELSHRFPKAYLKKRVLSLDIPDIYQYRQPELIRLLKARMRELVEPFLELEPSEAL